MHRIRKVMLLVLGVSLIGATLAAANASPRAAHASSGGTSDTGVRPIALKIKFRGVTEPLSTIGAATAALKPAAASGNAADLARFRQLIARGQTEGGENPPIVGWKIPKAKSLPVNGNTSTVMSSFHGTDFFASRYANGGNNFSSEPPDQGLCVNSSYELETTNSVLQVYDKSGNPQLQGTKTFPDGPAVGIDYNQFYNYAAAFVRPAGPFGPSLFDPSCAWDASSGRWFHLADTLGQRPVTGALTGKGWLDLAVSQTSDPLGRWYLYRIWTQNDGQDGTPNHHCDTGFCFADFPHFSVNAGGVFVTTNEYAFFGGEGYSGSQLYVLDKADLENGGGATTAAYFQNLSVPSINQKAFTVWPSSGTPGSFVSDEGGVQYFLSSTAGDGSETGNTTRGSDNIVVWALTGTSDPSDWSGLRLLQKVVNTEVYVFPPKALQRSGPTPLLRCTNQGLNCVGNEVPFKQEGPYPLDASDTRIQAPWLENGVLWGVLGTGLKGSGGSNYGPDNNFAPDPIDMKAGIAYFAFEPSVSGDHLSADVVRQGYLGVDGQNLTYPSITMGPGNNGIVGATLVGPDRYPSAVFVRLGLGRDPSAVSVAAGGIGPSDGFSGTFEGGFSPRWGDYGAAVRSPDGSLWFAAEYVNSRCGYEEYLNDFTCGFTRGFFGNYGTRLTQLSG